MRGSLIGAMAAVMIAGPVVAVTDPSGGSAPAQAQAGGAAPHAVPSPSALPPRHRPTVVERYVDLNSASRKGLMTLPGIGKEEADRIIANRPYLVKTDLVAKNVLRVGPFLSVRHLVVALPNKAPQDRF
jgi:hypothetical protein